LKWYQYQFKRNHRQMRVLVVLVTHTHTHAWYTLILVDKYLDTSTAMVIQIAQQINKVFNN